MATYYYTVIVQDSEPTNPQVGWIWVNETIGQAWIYLSGGWIPFAGI